MSAMGTSAAREHWRGKTGFLLAAVGSAVGLGNMWRFSYLAAENGGAAFVLLYLAFTLLIGLPVLLAELVIGRGAQRGPVGALRHLGGSGWSWLGLLFVGCGFTILAYYSVIAGWTTRLAVGGILSGFSGDAAARFEAVSSGAGAILWHGIFMAISVAVVAGGVRAGIERAARVLMPALFAILVGLALYAASLPGAGDGYARYLRPDPAELMSMDVVVSAAGQAFFSLSLGMGAMLAFASYLERDRPIAGESALIAGSDFGVAFVAGLVVFPILFALGLQDGVGESPVGALFITLPSAFAELGVAGHVVGALFFAALVVGALTSAVSILEVVVATAIEQLGWTRLRATLSVGIGAALIGILPARDLGILTVMDEVAGNVLLIAGSLALAVFLGWRCRVAGEELHPEILAAPWYGAWRALLRYAVPPVLLVVLGFSLATIVGRWFG